MDLRGFCPLRSQWRFPPAVSRVIFHAYTPVPPAPGDPTRTGTVHRKVGRNTKDPRSVPWEKESFDTPRPREVH